MVDNAQIAVTPAVEISYLAEKEQTALFETIESEDCTPSHAQAIRMKKLSQENKLDMDNIFSIMTEVKPNQQEKFKLKGRVFMKKIIIIFFSIWSTTFASTSVRNNFV